MKRIVMIISPASTTRKVSSIKEAAIAPRQFSNNASTAAQPVPRYTLGPSKRKVVPLLEKNPNPNWIIAAHQGEDKSLKQLKMTYTRGLVAKDDYAAALRGHQAAVDATKSPQREEAAALVLNCCEKQS